jgi:DNA-nicking Smr family endonuclease
LNASRIAVNPSPMAWDVGLDIESAQSFVRAGLNPDLLRKLRRGDWVVQGALDLHKHTQEQARVALGEFLSLARRQGWRCVRIVHGKGLSSPNREPVLKAKVRKWLQQRDDVLAYCEPRPHAGGSGAVHVLLAGAA